LSATILDAGKVLKSAAPFLQNLQILYKAPASLDELMKINSGIYYSYVQVGKFITVYPKTEDQFVYLTKKLYRLTRNRSAPAVPFDFKYRNGGCVYYRYGVFRSQEPENFGGSKISALKSFDGKPVADNREDGYKTPDWVINPFPQKTLPQPLPNNPLSTSYRIFHALSQRGKGGVYQAFRVNKNSLQICVIKEGRKNGETAWDGRDGCWRVRNEARVLPILRRSAVDVPRVFDSFEFGGNFYLVTEFIKGENLQKLVCRRQRRLSLLPALDCGVQISELISKIHVAGWVWRDCKPSNIVLTAEGKLRPLDFEGACRVGEPDPLPWSTPRFAPPEVFNQTSTKSNLAEDLFALGSLLFLLIDGELPVFDKNFEPSKISRRGVSEKIKQVVGDLLSRNPNERPRAQLVAQIFKTTRRQIKLRKSKKESR
jgi:serine/threonine protein kinase